MRTVQSGSASGVDDPAELLFAEMRPGSFGASESTLKMNIHNLVPLLVRHVLEAVIENTIRVHVSRV